MTDDELKNWIVAELASGDLTIEELCVRARAIGVPGHRIARMLPSLRDAGLIQGNLADSRTGRLRVR